MTSVPEIIQVLERERDAATDPAAREVWTKRIRALGAMLDELRKSAGLPGRPHVGPSREEDCVVQTRLPLSVKTRVDQAAAAAGVSAASWMRRLVSETVARQPAQPSRGRAVFEALRSHGVLADSWTCVDVPQTGGLPPAEQVVVIVEAALAGASL